MKSRRAAKRSVSREAGRHRVGASELTVHLSQAAMENLQRLQLQSLDRYGNSPTESELIEQLINSALEKQTEVFYPTKRRA